MVAGNKPHVILDALLAGPPSDVIPSVFTFQTTSRYFRADIDVSGTPTITWTLEDHGVETGDNTGLIDFGSTGLRTHTLVVDPWTDLLDMDLDVQASQIQVLTGTLDFRMMTEMTDLDMDGFDLANPGTVDTIRLNGLTKLEDFDAQDNAITSAGLQGLEDCSALEAFDFNNNLLTTMPSFYASAPPNMRRLVVEGNAITSIDLTGFGAVLDRLSFGGSGQPTVLPSGLANLTGLQTLIINGSGIVTATIPSGCLTANMNNFQIRHNASMTTLTLEAHTAAFAKGLNDNNLTQASVDALLAQHKAIAGLGSNDRIDLLGNSSPSDTGMQDAIEVYENGTDAFPEITAFDLTTATEVDPNGRIVVNSASKYTITGMTRDEDAHLYYDFGAGNIGGDVMAEFKFRIGAGSQAFGDVAVFCLSDSIESANALETIDQRILVAKIGYNGTRGTLALRYWGTGGQQFAQNLGAPNVIGPGETWRMFIVKTDNEGSFGSAYYIVDNDPVAEGFGFDWFESYITPRTQYRILFAERVNHRYFYPFNALDAGGLQTMDLEVWDYKFWKQ